VLKVREYGKSVVEQDGKEKNKKEKKKIQGL
jgi:hypothetical protein